MICEQSPDNGEGLVEWSRFLFNFLTVTKDSHPAAIKLLSLNNVKNVAARTAQIIPLSL